VTGLVQKELQGLAAALANLKVRVRLAVAGEIAGAVASAVREVVQATVAGDADGDRLYHRSVRRGWTDDGRQSWNDDDDDAPYGRRGTAAIPKTAIAAAAGIGVAQWWLSSNGSSVGAAGVGLAVGLVGLAGGPMILTLLAALAAIADLLAVTESLGNGADRLGQL
jgi:hypothetical protein